jgi:hypothetical protein
MTKKLTLRLDYDNGNYYVVSNNKAIAHFWDEGLAKAFLGYCENLVEKICMPKKTKPKAEKVPCPKCGKVVITLEPWVNGYLDLHFEHSCGYKGKLSFNRNQ